MAFGGSPRLAMALSSFVSKLGFILEAISNIYVKSINLEQEEMFQRNFNNKNWSKKLAQQKVVSN